MGNTGVSCFFLYTTQAMPRPQSSEAWICAPLTSIQKFSGVLALKQQHYLTRGLLTPSEQLCHCPRLGECVNSQPPPESEAGKCPYLTMTATCPALHHCTALSKCCSASNRRIPKSPSQQCFVFCRLALWCSTHLNLLSKM